MTATWFDKVKTCVGWNGVDQAWIAKLRPCLDSNTTELVEALGKQLMQFKGTQSLMENARFVQRLHSVLSEWLMGLLSGRFDEEYAEVRWAFVKELAEVDLTFEDVILLTGLARGQLPDLVQGHLRESPQTLSAVMQTLDKVLCLDLALIYNGYTQLHDAEIERSLLDRFLAITGFSRTLYENLAQAREWSRVDLQQAGLS